MERNISLKWLDGAAPSAVAAMDAEGAFKAWPSSIRTIFEPARTLRPGKPEITFHGPRAEAA